ncbi:trypsin-like serine peptidase [Sphingomonas sp. RS6]
MTKSLKDPNANVMDQSEEPNAGPPTSDQAPSQSDNRSAFQFDTEYEVVSGIDQNIKEPDTEASNTAIRVLGNETGWELGNTGASFGTEFDETSALDAIYGSYPELLEQMRQEVVIGVDNRVRVQATSSYPWRAICGLKIQAANGQRFIGTGWLISPRTVITAGHCVFLHGAGGWASSIEVVPGLNDASRPFGSHVGTALRSVTGWTQGKKRENDYGAIILPANSRPGAQTGTFGFATRDDAFLKNAMLNLSGYPGDKGGNQQWFMAQKAKSVSSRVLTYDIDTAGGQSGAPVWILQNNQRYAVGIHTNGAASGNSATRIVKAVFDNLLAWKALGA